MKLRRLFARVREKEFPDVPAWQHDIRNTVAPFTMTSKDRTLSLTEAISYISKARIPGAIVECGVWRGGSMMTCALTLMHQGNTERELYLFDTFSGMTLPTAVDVDHAGISATKTIKKFLSRPDKPGWCEASIDDVRTNMQSTGYPMHNIRLVQGPVENTIPENAPSQIALLRLDTDWYESTKHELEHLYDRVPTGGVVIVDDYGHWAGARKATDEFLRDRNIDCLLYRVDYTARMFIKPPGAHINVPSGPCP